MSGFGLSAKGGSKRKAQLAARFKEWRTCNRERFAQVQRESYRRNYAKNYPRYLANARNRRAKASLAVGSHTSEEVRAMLRDQGGVCALAKGAMTAEEFLAGRDSSGNACRA